MSRSLAMRLAAMGVLLLAVVVSVVVSRGQPVTEVGAVSSTPGPSGSLSTEPPSPMERPSRPATTTGSPPAKPAGSAPPTPAPSVEPTDDVASVARLAVLAWQSPKDEAREEALRGIATPAYQDAAKTIDASRVPAAPPVTAAVRVEADGQALVDVELEDGTALAVLLVFERDRWLLDDLQPVTSTEAGGTG